MIEIVRIDTKDLYKEFLEFKQDPEVQILSQEDKDDYVLFKFNTKDKIEVKKSLLEEDKYTNDLIFGKDKTKNVTNISIKDNSLHIFTETDGRIEEEVRPASYWIVAKNKYNGFNRVTGNNYYNYIRYYDVLEEFRRDRGVLRNKDIWSVYDNQESNLITSGITYFKGMKVTDASTLSFDIETTGTAHNDDSKVLLISNTLTINGEKTRRCFKYDDYDSDAAMIYDWCEWVREVNPSILLGHNIFGFDLPYMSYCYKREYDNDMLLGRDESPIEYDSYVSHKRKDGSQSYDYNNAKIFGRDVIDTFFLAISFDIGRKYSSYALKTIIKEEGLEKENRQHYDASKIAENYLIPEEWKKIVAYGSDDADDSDSLYYLMIPAFFYFAQSVPKTLQQIINSASGAQVNSFLVRSYISVNKGLPKASDLVPYEGAISLGVPGVYKNIAKLDIKSMYPSIILQEKIYNKHKDPDGNFLKMVEYFTAERLKNKQLAKETNDRYYKELEAAEKIIINSSYGLLGAPGLLFNSPYDAALVTKKGRDILKEGVMWASGQDIKKNEDDEYILINTKNKGKGFIISNIDTDSFSFTNNSIPINEKQYQEWINELNSIMPDKIEWADDGIYDDVCILKAKNYALRKDGKIKFKGSAIIDAKREPALIEFIKTCIVSLLDNKKSLKPIYDTYMKEIVNIKDIKRWATKKTVTEKVLNSDRTTESKVRDAIGDKHIQEGDKIWLYNANPVLIPRVVKGEPTYYKDGRPKMKEDSPLKLIDKWTPGDEYMLHYVERLYDTLTILENLVKIEEYPKYFSKDYRDKLKDMFK